MTPPYNGAESHSPTRQEEGDVRARAQSVMAGEAPITLAVKWLDDRLVDRPDADRLKLVDEAARRFDLTPLDTEFLYRHLAQRKK